MTTNSEVIDHGKGIDAFYAKKKADRDREHAKYVQMQRDGASSAELQKQEDRWIQAGDCGD